MLLTTITPFWGRPKMLERWLESIKTAAHPLVHHILIFSGDPIPKSLGDERFIRIIRQAIPKSGARPSIGHYHNMGAVFADTEWIMKLDVDALPNSGFFTALMPILAKAKPREWFNAGMFYVNKQTSEAQLNPGSGLLQQSVYQAIVERNFVTTGLPLARPAATNFICRAADYLRLGGCDSRFHGWGWEDYQQIYMLEKFQQGQDPLMGDLTLDNIVHRCRDEISRRKAAQLYTRDLALALLHCWHPTPLDLRYKSPVIVSHNRRVLLDYIAKERGAEVASTAV